MTSVSVIALVGIMLFAGLAMTINMLLSLKSEIASLKDSQKKAIEKRKNYEEDFFECLERSLTEMNHKLASKLDRVSANVGSVDRLEDSIRDMNNKMNETTAKVKNALTGINANTHKIFQDLKAAVDGNDVAKLASAMRAIEALDGNYVTVEQKMDTAVTKKSNGLSSFDSWIKTVKAASSEYDHIITEYLPSSSPSPMTQSEAVKAAEE